MSDAVLPQSAFEFVVPVARPKKLSARVAKELFGGLTRPRRNETVNNLRQAVGRRRLQGYLELCILGSANAG
jgi:hypothetical protein